MNMYALNRPIPFAITVSFLVLMSNIVNALSDKVAASHASLKWLSIEELLEVEGRSISRRTEKLSQTASSAQVITQDEIPRSGATGLPEALRLATNLQIAQVYSTQWSISARGFNNVLANKLLVIIDGRTVYTPLYVGVFWDAQNILLADVDRIGVVCGPGGTMWESKDVNGVINIIKKNTNTQGIPVEGGLGKAQYIRC